MEDKYAIYLDKLERFCGYQERCIADVKKKMVSMKVENEFQEKLITSLIEEQFINEKRYALFFIKGKVNYKRDGFQKIKFALSQKQIPNPIINEIIDELDKEQYVENVEILLNKKWTQLNIKNEKQEAKSKLIRYMMGKGYKYDEFKDYLKKLN